MIPFTYCGVWGTMVISCMPIISRTLSTPRANSSGPTWNERYFSAPRLADAAGREGVSMVAACIGIGSPVNVAAFLLSALECDVSVSDFARTPGGMDDEKRA